MTVPTLHRATRRPVVAETPPQPGIWEITLSVRGHDLLGDYLPKAGRRGVLVNDDELSHAERELMFERHAGRPPPFFGTLGPLPDGFPRARLYLPEPITLDLISVQGRHFYSERLRAAMAVPDEAAQFIPVELEDSHDTAHAKGYAWLAWRYLERDVVDRERSTCRWKEGSIDPSTGEPSAVFERGSGRVVTRADFVPRFDLFTPVEQRSVTCVTPALEERVRKAGLVGARFDEFGANHFATYWMSDEDGPPRLRRMGED
jgi:hypothetical protein